MTEQENITENAQPVAQSLYKGVVLPKGTIPATRLQTETAEIEILFARGENDGVEGAESEFHMVGVKYPDNFVRHHQVRDLEHLFELVTSQLKNRYALAGFEFLTAPQSLAPGLFTIGAFKYDA